MEFLFFISSPSAAPSFKGPRTKYPNPLKSSSLDRYCSLCQPVNKHPAHQMESENKERDDSGGVQELNTV